MKGNPLDGTRADIVKIAEGYIWDYNNQLVGSLFNPIEVCFVWQIVLKV